MTRYVGLLQGVNVGGRKLPMATLREVVAGAGGVDVRTSIQSGNVVFDHPGEEGTVRAEVEARVGAAAGFAVPVALRTLAAMRAVVEGNPFPTASGPQLHVMFLVEPLAPGALDGLDVAASSPEELVATERELYLHLPDGMGRARLPAALARGGGPGSKRTPATTRNWNTVLRLTELAAGP